MHILAAPIAYAPRYTLAKRAPRREAAAPFVTAMLVTTSMMLVTSLRYFARYVCLAPPCFSQDAAQHYAPLAHMRAIIRARMPR